MSVDNSSTSSPRNSLASGVKPGLSEAGGIDIPVTQQAWIKLTGLDAPALKKFVIDTVLPDLPVFLEWRKAVIALENQSPSRAEVKTTMHKDFAVIHQEPDAFVRSNNIDNRLVWAHTVHRIKRHLSRNQTCIENFMDRRAWDDASFDFLKFLGKNMTGQRFLSPNKIRRASQVSKDFVKRKHSQ
jgi:hypothetical protein